MMHMCQRPGCEGYKHPFGDDSGPHGGLPPKSQFCPLCATMLRVIGDDEWVPTDDFVDEYPEENEEYDDDYDNDPPDTSMPLSPLEGWKISPASSLPLDGMSVAEAAKLTTEQVDLMAKMKAELYEKAWQGVQPVTPPTPPSWYSADVTWKNVKMDFATGDTQQEGTDEQLPT